MTHFKARYEIDDGYVGKSRPMSFYIEIDDDMKEMTDEELECLLDELIDEDFKMSVFPFPTNLEEFIETVRSNE